MWAVATRAVGTRLAVVLVDWGGGYLIEYVREAGAWLLRVMLSGVTDTR